MLLCLCHSGLWSAFWNDSDVRRQTCLPVFCAPLTRKHVAMVKMARRPCVPSMLERFSSLSPWTQTWTDQLLEHRKLLFIRSSCVDNRFNWNVVRSNLNIASCDILAFIYKCFLHDNRLFCSTHAHAQGWGVGLHVQIHLKNDMITTFFCEINKSNTSVFFNDI